jgi:hypothetical protein
MYGTVGSGITNAVPGLSPSVSDIFGLVGTDSTDDLSLCRIVGGGSFVGKPEEVMPRPSTSTRAKWLLPSGSRHVHSLKARSVTGVRYEVRTSHFPPPYVLQRHEVNNSSTARASMDHRPR